MKFIKTSLLLFFGCLIALSSCTNDDGNSEIVIIKVNHFKQSGEGLFPFQFLLVNEGNTSNGNDWSFFYDDIEGFEYQLGYLYTLKVEKENIENPPADGSSFRYKLIKEISKEKVSSIAIFQIRLSKSSDDGGFLPFFKKTGISTFELLDGTRIDCGSFCDELQQKLSTKKATAGTFKHSNTNEILLIDL